MASGASAGQASPAELADMPLEELVRIQVVSAASRRPQAAREAPAVVTVVSADEIRRHGYRTLADVLATLPGFYATYDRNYTYLGVRGFGLPGDYNTRVLLLLNGTRTNDNIYDGAYFGREFVLDADLIERIEVSKGPGASVYGNSAFFAVVNVVTPSGRSLDGGQVAAAAGSFGTYATALRYGRRSANGLDVVGSVSALDSSGQTLSFPEFSAVGGGIARGADTESAVRAFGSLSFKGAGLDAAYVDRRKRIPTAAYGTAFGDTRARTWDELLLLTARYGTSFGKRLAVDAALSSGSYNYAGDYPYETGPQQTDVFEDLSSGRWWEGRVTATLHAGAHTLLAGGEYHRDTGQRQAYGYAGAPDLDLDIGHSGKRLGLFVQDDVALAPWLRASLGARFDRDFGRDRADEPGEDTLRDQLNPRLGLILMPDTRTTLKLLYGSAFRAPNEYERHYYSAQEPDLAAETIRSWEASVERALGSRARIVGSVYTSRIEQLITLDATAAGDLFFRNTAGAETLGAELALELKLASGAAGRVGHSLQDTQAAGAPATNSPRHLLQAALSVPLAGGRVWAGADALYMSSRLTPAGPRTGAFAVANLNLLVKELPGALVARLSVRNLFDRSYADPASAEHRQAAIQQDGRSVRVELSRRF